MDEPVRPTSTVRRLTALLRLRCPRCHRGRIFAGRFRMNDPCPECGLIFQREEGYFLGAMYFTYLIGIAVMGSLFLAGLLLFPGWAYLVFAVICVGYLFVTPAVFRYSRAFWIYADRWACPTDISAGPYEKVQAQKFSGSGQRSAT